jgi:hypothetical protein
MTSTSAPLRHTVISSRRLIASSTMARLSAVVDPIGSPATDSTTSPTRRPDCAAGLFGITCATCNPPLRPVLAASARGSGM